MKNFSKNNYSKKNNDRFNRRSQSKNNYKSNNLQEDNFHKSKNNNLKKSDDIKKRPYHKGNENNYLRSKEKSRENAYQPQSKFSPKNSNKKNFSEENISEVHHILFIGLSLVKEANTECLPHIQSSKFLSLVFN